MSKVIAGMLLLGITGGAAAAAPGGQATPDRLILRFPEATEEYALTGGATYCAYVEDGRGQLTVAVSTGAAITQRETMRELHPQPSWELTWKDAAPTLPKLEVGKVFTIPRGFDDDADEYLVDFYYFEHEESDDNTIEVLARDGDRLRLRLRGTWHEYRGKERDRAPVAVEVTATFTLDPRLRQSSE